MTTKPSVIFHGAGTFQALWAAEAFMRRAGWSMGPGCAPHPTGCMYGDYAIAKWRNLTPAEQQGCHAVMTGDRRNGPLAITLNDCCPAAGREAFLREASELEGIA